jgi:nucleotide-binding universal stress UspA family protein
MLRLERIIVGHDLRSGGATALESALVLARRYEATIRLIHVIEPHHHCLHVSPSKSRQSMIEERATSSGIDLEEIVDRRTDRRRRIDYEVRVGNPFFELILAACAWHADLIVVGGPDRQPFHLLGSTAERLVRKSFVPVLVTRKPLNQIAKRFLVPTDFSLAARRVAAVGITLADSFGGRIFFFHAFDPTPWYRYPCDEETLGLITLPELTVDDVEGEWASFLRSLPTTSVPWQARTAEGRPVDMIVKYADEIAADLILMGSLGQTGLEHILLGSVAEGVVRRASPPVLTIGPEGLRFSFL